MGTSWDGDKKWRVWAAKKPLRRLDDFRLFWCGDFSTAMLLHNLVITRASHGKAWQLTQCITSYCIVFHLCVQEDQWDGDTVQVCHQIRFNVNLICKSLVSDVLTNHSSVLHWQIPDDFIITDKSVADPGGGPRGPWPPPSIPDKDYLLCTSWPFLIKKAPWP